MKEILLNVKQFLKWLMSQGVTVESGTKHYKLYLGHRRSILPRHSHQLKKGLMEAVKRQLGLK